MLQTGKYYKYKGHNLNYLRVIECAEFPMTQELSVVFENSHGATWRGEISLEDATKHYEEVTSKRWVFSCWFFRERLRGTRFEDYTYQETVV